MRAFRTAFFAAVASASAGLGVASAQGAPPKVSKLAAALDALKSKDPGERRLAAEEIGGLGPDARSAVAQLARVLHDEGDSGVKTALATALGAIGPEAKDAVPELGRALGDRDSRVRTAAADALGKIGPRAYAIVPLLGKSMRRDADAASRNAAADALVRIGPSVKDVLAALTEALEDAQPAVRALAASSLGRIGRPAKSSIDALSNLRNDANGDVRKAAEEALRRIESPETEGAESSPTPSSSEPAPDVQPPRTPKEKRAALMQALAEIGSATPSDRVRGAKTLGSLGFMGNAGVPALVKALRDDRSEDVRREAAAALGEIASDDVISSGVPMLGRALSDGSAPVRREAARALGKIGPKAWPATRVLVKTLVSDADGGVRRESKAALAKLGNDPKEVVPALVDALANADEDARMRAALALGERGPDAKGAVAALVAALKDKEPFVRRGAADALAEMGGDAKSALAALEAAKTDADARVRRRAEIALARIDPSRAPAVAAVEPPHAPPIAEPPAPSPTPAGESRPAEPVVPPAAPSGDLRSRVSSLLEGEGGATSPSASVEGDAVTLDLKLEHPRFDVDMGQRDAARLCLKIAEEMPSLERWRVRILANDGRVLSTDSITAERVRPFLAKLDDPFERRRIGEWWSQMVGR